MGFVRVGYELPAPSIYRLTDGVVHTWVRQIAQNIPLCILHCRKMVTNPRTFRKITRTFRKEDIIVTVS